MNTLSCENSRVVYIGMYSDPEAQGGNRLLWTQAHEVSQLLYSVEIITWPKKSAWTGKFPLHNLDLFNHIPTLNYSRKGIQYHVISPPPQWGVPVSTDKDWRASVEWAKSLLTHLNPSIVHQHYWQNTWYFMEAALQLKIPTIYTAYDWGLPCRRQFLVTDKGLPCIATPSKTTCLECCSSSNFHSDSQPISTTPNLSIAFQIDRLFKRWYRIAKRLNALIVTSPFAKQFYQTVSVDSSIIYTMPWFYNQPIVKSPSSSKKTRNFMLGFIGRLVPEKGLHLLLEALTHLDNSPELTLEIAGLVNSNYARLLQKSYSKQVGKHNVRWLGWMNNGDLGAFFNRIDVLIVPSLWYDNTPTVLAEALAHGCPVICTRLPSMTHLIHHRKNGLVFEMNNSDELAACISEFYNNKGLALRLRRQASYSIDSKRYAYYLIEIYKQLLSGSKA